MVPRTHSEDSDPVLQVSAIGTANSEGEYLQHEAVVPHKAHSAQADAVTVVVQSESAHIPDASAPPRPPAAVDALQMYPADEEVTSVTKGKLRAKGWGWYRLVAFIENHRAATFMFAIGGLMLLLAGILALP